MTAPDPDAAGHSYTRGRRQPYLVRKWPGSNWALPLGPYTVTQLVAFVGTVYLLFSQRELWARFGPANLLVWVGLPLAATYLTRHSRVEGRDPLRAAVALAGLLTRPAAGYLGDAPLRRRRTGRQRAGRFPVAALPASLALTAPSAASSTGPSARTGAPATAVSQPAGVPAGAGTVAAPPRTPTPARRPPRWRGQPGGG